MTEFNGNPESGVDQLLNRSAGIDLPSDTKPSYEELETKLASMIADRDYWLNSAKKYSMVIDTAKESIEEVLASDVDAEQTYADFKDAFDLLGVSIEREVDVTVTVTFTGTMTLPAGVDPEDLGAYDWSAELEHNYYGSDFTVDDIEAKEN